MERHSNITHVKGDCWKINFLQKCKLQEIYFFCNEDPSSKTIEEIMTFPQVERDISFRQALLQIGLPQIPNKFRQQKKLFRRITDDVDTEEHF